MKNNQSKSYELFSDYPDILSVKQLMELLQIGKVLAYKLIESKKFKAVKIGREYKILKNSVIDFINERS
jgi:excisionase family DNA binding protein